MPVELEWDEMDASSWHALAFTDDGTPVATGRLLPDGHIGRINLTSSAYLALGRDRNNFFNSQPSDIRAYFGAAEASMGSQPPPARFCAPSTCSR